jgi:hypothetical protein
MGFLSALGKIGKLASWLPIPGANYIGKASDALSAGADVLSGVGKANAQNKSNQLTAAEHQAILANQTSGANDAARQNAWTNLLNADYVTNNKGYQPATFHSSVPGMADHTLPSFGIARQPFGAAAMAGAQGMQNESLKRLQGGPQLTTPDLTGMAKPSVWSHILDVAAPAMKFGSQLKFDAKPPIAMNGTDDEIEG